MMNSFLKKAFLVYILFLFTTLSGSPIQFTESSSTESDITFQKIKEQITKGNTPKEKTFEEEILTKDLPIRPSAPVKKQKAEEKPLGITPALIEIPAIDARAKVIQVGQMEDGRMEAPESIHEIGWYEPGTKPGNAGNAVLAGHVDGLKKPGTFYNLKKLKPGDKIHITGTTGEELIFVVKEKKAYLPEDAPLEEIFGGSSTPQLNLITCTGTFNTKIGHYEERLVIYTELIES